MKAVPIFMSHKKVFCLKILRSLTTDLRTCPRSLGLLAWVFYSWVMYNIIWDNRPLCLGYCSNFRGFSVIIRRIYKTL